jgi:hypothetical protein
MTGYTADEALERAEAALCCQALACLEARRERDRAREVAVALEQELAEVKRLLRSHTSGLSLPFWAPASLPEQVAAGAALRHFMAHGSLPEPSHE